MKIKKFLSAGAALLLLLSACGNTTTSSLGGGVSSATPETSYNEPADSTASTPAVSSEIPEEYDGYTAIALPDEMRAMWLSYYEVEALDFSSAEALRASVGRVYENCAELGLNTVIVAVRPFGDALYPSDIFPWSHLITGTQGGDPGFDPLPILIEEAHTRDLRFEAWLNPFRVTLSNELPGTLSSNNPALGGDALTITVEERILYDPGQPTARELIVQGVREIVENYDVDGIHFDDYFYPELTADQKEAGYTESMDETTYAAYGNGMGLADWRRQNVSTLMAEVYSAIKAANPTVVFGISPQGNNDNNYDIQYSDVRQWLANPGYADYIMPQLYWGFNYQQSSGSTRYAFPNITAEWASYSRDDGVKLYAGLGAYRVDTGTDGGYGDQSEWQSGESMARMVEYLRSANGYSGFALFRYASLYESESIYAPEEINALQQLLN